MSNIAKPVLKLDFLFDLLAKVTWEHLGEKKGQVAFLSWPRAREGLRSTLRARFPVQGQMFEGTWNDIP